MISEIEEHVDQSQINIICQKIVFQYRKYLHYINNKERKELFAPEYSSHRAQHDLSYAIVSAFRDGSRVAGFDVMCMKDQGGHTRPELVNELLIIHIQSKKIDTKANYLKSYYQKNSNCFSGKQLYCYIQFEEKSGQLLKIMLCLPNEFGDVVQKEVLMNQIRIIELVS